MGIDNSNTILGWVISFGIVAFMFGLFAWQEDISRIKTIIREIKRKREEYERKKKIYDEFLKKTGELRSKVWEIVNQAIKYDREIKLAKVTFDKHLELAGQDRTIAERFFRNTYKDREDLIQEVLGNPQ